MMRRLVRGGWYRLRSLATRVRHPVRGRRRPRETDLSAAVPFAPALASATKPPGRLAVVCHLYHHDLAAEFREHLEPLRDVADVYLSTDTPAKAEQIEAAFVTWTTGKVTVRVAPNRGRDIAPKLVTFRDALVEHDLVLFLHGKRSLTVSIGDQWRRTLIKSLIGSREVIGSILTIFERRPDIGIIMAQHFEPIQTHLFWDGNYLLARRLGRRMGFRVGARRALDFTSGSMFWARTAALRPLLSLNLTFDDFPAENGQIGGTLQHAIERLFLFSCEAAGFGWMKVADPASFPATPGITPILDEADLNALIETSRLDLLAPRRGSGRQQLTKSSGVSQ